MTGKTIVDHIKLIIPEAASYSDGVFLTWLNELEADIQLNLYCLNTEDVVTHKALTEELMADVTHRIIYELYLTVMIDLARREYTRYQNGFEVFSKEFGSYKTWYIMRYHPGDGMAEVSGYYLSAYALAVKHGFTGTEDEWIAAVEAARLSAETSAAAAATSAAAAALAESNVAQNTTEALEAKIAAETARDASVAAKESAIAAKNAAETAQAAAETAEAHALSSETNAGTHESGAQTAKTGAETAKDTAVTAKNAAETAKNAAELAKAAAQTAQSLAETAKTAAETAKTDAIAAKDAAVTAKNASVVAQGLAETAKTAAQGAQTAAEAAKMAAQTAEANAEGSAEDAEAWAVGKRNGVDVGSGDPAYHNNALYYKNQAAEIVGGDYSTKTEAQGYATTAKTEAITAAATDATTKANAAQSNANTSAQGYVSTHNSAADAHSALFGAKLDKTGDGSNVTTAFTQAASRTNLATGEKLSVSLGKAMKWFADLGTAAFSAASSFAAAVHTHTKSQITDFPTSMTPTAHKSSHATGGGDALTPSDIGAAARISGTATLAIANWTGGAAPYTYTLTVAGILATDTPHVDRVTGTDAAAAALINTAWGLISGYAVKPQTAAGTITFYASAKPAVAIPIMYEVVRS